MAIENEPRHAGPFMSQRVTMHIWSEPTSLVTLWPADRDRGYCFADPNCRHVLSFADVHNAEFEKLDPLGQPEQCRSGPGSRPMQKYVLDGPRTQLRLLCCPGRIVAPPRVVILMLGSGTGTSASCFAAVANNVASCASLELALQWNSDLFSALRFVLSRTLSGKIRGAEEGQTHSCPGFQRQQRRGFHTMAPQTVEFRCVLSIRCTMRCE